MTEKNWSLNGLQHPSAVHICLTLRHAQAGIAERFITDLKDSVAYVKANPNALSEDMDSLYGMSATIPLKGVLEGLMEQFCNCSALSVSSLIQPGCW